MDLAAFRLEKDRFMKTHPQSPLTQQQKRTFTGLRYYPENPDLRFDVSIVPDAVRPTVQMATSTGEVRSSRRTGSFEFPVKEKKYRLYVYQDEEGGDYFLPFKDKTSGKETYGAGRYLEIEPLGNGKYRVDFNMAYSPYCAYNEHWSCPIPPRENVIDAAIEAGEKAYHE